MIKVFHITAVSDEDGTILLKLGYSPFLLHSA